MNSLSILLKECISLIDEIYQAALIEEINKVKSKSSLLINKLNELFPILLEGGFQINPIFIEKIENLLAAIEVRDSIGVMDIAGFEIKSILNEYLESIGGVVERE